MEDPEVTRYKQARMLENQREQRTILALESSARSLAQISDTLQRLYWHLSGECDPFASEAFAQIDEDGVVGIKVRTEA